MNLPPVPAPQASVATPRTALKAIPKAMLSRGVFILAAALAIAAGGYAAVRLNEARNAAKWVTHTHEVLNAIEEIRGAHAAVDAASHALIDAVNATGHDPKLHATNTANALAHSRALTEDNPAQLLRLDTLEDLMQQKLDVLARTVGHLQAGNRDSADDIVRGDEGAHRSLHIGQLLAAMTTAEHALLRDRVEDQVSRSDRGRLAVFIALGASIILVGVGAFALSREARRARAAAAVALHAEQLARKSESRFRAALDSMIDAFYIARPQLGTGGEVSDFVFVEANGSGAALLGRPLLTLSGSRLSEVAPASRTSGLFDTLRHVAKTGERYLGEYRVADPRGGAEWLRLQVVPTLDGVAVTCHDITPNKTAEAALADLAIRDELTGLLNRRGFRELAEQEMKVARRERRPDSIVALDLNDFKHINDAYGHAEGDIALRTVAELLRRSVREGDIVARIGGDEFVIYVPASREGHDNSALTHRLQAAFAASNAVARSNRRPYDIETGIGVSAVEANDDLDTLLQRADAALYTNKGRGPHGAA